MPTTLSRETTDAVSHFKAKLEYEVGPHGVNELINRKEPVKIIDLRTPELFAKGHIPTAINIQFEELDKHLNKLDKNKTTIVYCYNITCNLSTRAALHLAEKGYKVQELVGGWTEWESAGLAKQEATHTSHCATSKGSSCG